MRIEQAAINDVRICSRCVMDSAVPEIAFDAEGICNYCRLHNQLDHDFPNDERGAAILRQLIAKVKKDGEGKEYDVVIGVSGGTDSTYLLHLAKEHGLRPLAVHLDNGWNTDISVSNLTNAIRLMKIDLHTYVINWDEFRDILVAQLKSGLPWADFPTDIAIISTLYKTAAQFNVKHIFVGNNFRTEGRQPDLWTHSDGKQLKHIQKKFGTRPFETFPNQTLWQLFYYTLVKRIKMTRPYYYIRYNKSEAKKLIMAKYKWVDYGGHHHENVFTRYIIGVWLPQKFGIDKRKVTFSAYIRNGEMKREEALRQLQEPPYSPEMMKKDQEYVIKKLGLSEAEFREIWNAPNKTFHDYPSYYPLYTRLKKLAVLVFRYVLPFKPLMAYELRGAKN